MDSGLTPDDIILSRSGNDLVVKIIGSGDSRTLQSWFDDKSAGFYQIERVQFGEDAATRINGRVRAYQPFALGSALSSEEDWALAA